MRTYETEFSEDLAPPTELLNLLKEKGWLDTSWHNDTCPSFENKELGLRLWIDHVERNQRELPHMSRFGVVTLDDMETLVFECETVEEIMGWLNTH